MRPTLVASTILPLAITLLAPAQAELPEAKQITLPAAIDSVTLYQDRAMITRTCAIPDDLGTYEIRIEGLPASIDPASLSASAEGAKLLDVRFESVTTTVDASSNPELRKAIADLEAAQRQAQLLALRGERISDQHALLNAIASKTATENAKDFGSKALDPEQLARQLKFIEQSRDELIGQRTALDEEATRNKSEVEALAAKVNALGGKTVEARAAVVTVGRSARGSATLATRYLVWGAGWRPDYAVRAVDAGDDAADRLTVEFNALVTQATGEDWTDVSVTLSTAAPTRRPAPPEVSPVYLDVQMPVVASGSVEGYAGNGREMRARKSAPAMAPGRPAGPGGGGGGYGTGGAEGGVADAAAELAFKVELDKAYADASASGGAVVTYALPRKVTVPSDAKRTRTQRVATVDLKPEFSHVARPIVDSTVYLRAKARNTSSYRLIAGSARLFVGEDSVGTTDFPTVNPGAEVTFWLGGDPRLECKRSLVSKETREQGVFGKETVETSKWRIDLVSSAGGATRVEISDRVPVSRNEQIKVELRDLSVALSTDAKYLKDDRPRGILLWSVDMPGVAGDGKPRERSISWTTQVSHAVDVAVGSSGD